METITTTIEMRDYAQEEKLLKENKGVNLLNYNDDTGIHYYVTLRLEVDLNLLKQEEKIVINSNLPFCDYSYTWGENNLEKFFNDFKKWVCKPQFNEIDLKRYNRKQDNKFSVSSYHPPFREKQITFDEIKITIMPIAQEYLSRKNILKTMKFTFIEGIKEMCNKQRQATEQESIYFNRFYELKERLDDFKRQIPKQNNYCSYRSDDEVEQPMKITLTSAEYNKKLKAIEKEMKSIIKRFGFLEMPSIYYWEQEDEEDNDEVEEGEDIEDINDEENY